MTGQSGGRPVRFPGVRAAAMAQCVMDREATPRGPDSDPGLKRLLTLTFTALVVSLVLAALGAYLAVRLFGAP